MGGIEKQKKSQKGGQKKQHQSTNALKTERVNLSIEPEIYEELMAIASEKHLKTIDVVRRFIRLGLAINRLEAQGCELILRNGNSEKKVVLI